MERETLTVSEAAKLLGVAPATVYAAVKRGELPAIRIGDRILIPELGLRRLLEPADPLDRPAAASR